MEGSDERMEASRPKKKFLAGDVRKMHDILSKNMYKIRQKTLAYTNKYNLPDNSRAREILIRRHASIRRSLRAGSLREMPEHNIPRSQKYYSLQPGGDLESAFALRRRSHGGSEVDRISARLQSSGESPRSSSRSLASMRRLNTIKELGGPGEPPAASADPHTPSPGVNTSGQRVSGSLRGRKAPVPAPRRRSTNQVEEDDDNVETEHPDEGEESVDLPQLPPPGVWIPENQDPRENETGNPLLRHSSQGSRGSGR